MLRDDIQQALVLSVAFQKFFDRFVQLGNFRDGQGVLHHPGKNSLQHVIPILLHIQKNGIFYPILNIHIMHDFLDLDDDLTDLIFTIWIEFIEKSLIIQYVLFGIDPDHTILDPNGNFVPNKLDLQPQLLEHWEYHTGILHGSYAPVIDKAIAFKRVDETSTFVLLLAEQY